MSDTTINPPDNLVIVTGAWGTDVTEDLTTHLSGGRSIKFLPTTPAADPVIATAQYIPCDGGRSYTFDATLRADSVTAGNTMAVSVYWYDVRQAYISATAIYASAVLPAANSWIFIRTNAAAPATARYARLVATKNNTAFSGWLDSWTMNPATPFGIYSTDDDNIASGGASLVLNTVVEESGMTLDTGTGIITLLEPGVYAVTGSVFSTDSIVNGGSVVVIGTGAGVANLTAMWTNSTGASIVTQPMNGATLFRADAGDTFYVSVIHAESGAIGFSSYFTIARVA